MKLNPLENWGFNEGALESSIEPAQELIRHPLPIDYLEYIRKCNGGEGFVGTDFLILWRIEELAKLNQEYELERYAPGLVLFGSSGGGEGYGFDFRHNNCRIVRVPFVGMEWRLAVITANSFTEFLNTIATHAGNFRHHSITTVQRTPGAELFEIKPILLGGSPTDPSNKVWLTRIQHTEAVRYWNRIITDLRRQHGFN